MVSAWWWLASRARLIARQRDLARQTVRLRAERDANAAHVAVLRKALKERAQHHADQYAALQVDHLEASVRLAALRAERPDLLVQLGRMSNQLFEAKAGASHVAVD